VFLRGVGEGPELAAAVVELESKVLSGAGGNVVFAGTTEMDAVFSECREAVGVSPSEERRCQLQAARRLFVEHVLELNVEAVDGQPRISLTVWDPGSNAKLFVQLRDVNEEKTLVASVDSLADEYLCFRGVLSACPEQRALAGLTRDGWLEVRDVEPATATVFVGGEAVAVGAVERFDLPSGPVDVRLEAEGYSPHTVRVSLGPAQKTLLEGVRLDRLPCEAGDAAACRESCEGGSMHECVLLGRMHVDGLGEVQDLAAAERLFDKACDTENADGCLAGALVRYRMSGATEGVQHELESLCDEGHAASCFALGLYRFESAGDGAGERTALDRACELGHARACATIADFLGGGRVNRSAEPDRGGTHSEEVTQLDTRACELGDAVACVDLNNKEAGERGRTLFLKACTEGPGEQCYSGRMGGYNATTEANQVLSRQLETCPGTRGAACLWAGWAYTSTGYGGSQLSRELPGDEAKAHEAYRLGREFFTGLCDDGVPEGCYSLGVLVREGLGGNADAGKAYELFRSTCVGSITGKTHGASCNEVGALVEQGYGPRPGQPASFFFEKGCEDGYVPACSRGGCASCSLATTHEEPGMAWLLVGLSSAAVVFWRRR